MKWLYDLGPVCGASTCTRPDKHAGRHNQFDSPHHDDALDFKAQQLGCAGCGSKTKLAIVVTETVRAICKDCQAKLLCDVTACAHDLGAAEQHYTTELLKLDAAVARLEQDGGTIEAFVAGGALSAETARNLREFRATRRR